MLEKIPLTQKYSFVKSVYVCTRVHACASKWVCVCVCMCVCSCGHAYVKVWIYVFLCVNCGCAYLRVCVWIYVCDCLCMHVWVYMFVHVSLHEYMCVCMHVWVWVNVFTCVWLCVHMHACVYEMMYVCVPCLDIPALSSQQGGHTVCWVSLRPELCVLNLKINSTYIPSSHPGDFWKIRSSEGS